MEYDPWGKISRLEPSTAVDQILGFTGQELDPETDLYYYDGRYYDQQLARFVQPDPFVQNPGDPQNLNRYSYVLNNPYRYIDPSGYDWEDWDEGYDGGSGDNWDTGNSINSESSWDVRWNYGNSYDSFSSQIYSNLSPARANNEFMQSLGFCSMCDWQETTFTLYREAGARRSIDLLRVSANYFAGFGDFLTGGFMNTFNFSERVFGQRAISVTQAIRIYNETDYIVNQSSTAYRAGEYTGMATGTALFWTAGLNGAGNSVFWHGWNNTVPAGQAYAEASALGTTLEGTAIGRTLNFMANQAQINVPGIVWKAASATFTLNAIGPVQAVIRGSVRIDSTWATVELPILVWRGVTIIYK
jgi:RHS repeat-associated protein